MAQKFPQETAQEKRILDSNTGNPVSEIIIEEGKVIIKKENGQEVSFPLNSVRAKHILMRLSHGISEITEAIYV